MNAKIMFCQCGCGLPLPDHNPKYECKKRRFIDRHYSRSPQAKDDNAKRRIPRLLCACGCGERIPFSSLSTTRFIWGHQVRGESPWAEKFKQVRARGIAKAKLILTGGHGFGRAQRDAPDHFQADHWVIRSPDGKIHQFQNLDSWIRKNEELFTDHRPDSKTPLWRRASVGLHRASSGYATQWYGWVVVSHIEQACGAPDLINRTP